MNKSELIDALAQKLGITKVDAKRNIEGVLEVITETLAQGDEVAVIGFGTFGITKREARTGRNPANGKPIQIPASKSPKFVAGKALKDAINK